MKIYNIVEKIEFLQEVATLEYDEWAQDKENDRINRIKNKIEEIKSKLNENDFCKLVLIDDNKLVGFISIFPQDSEECL